MISARLLRRAYLWLGLLQAAAAMGALFVAYAAQGFAGRWLSLPGEGPAHRVATTAVLATVVATQLGNLYAQRAERVSILRVGFGGNRLLLAGIAVALLLLAALVHLPPLQRAFGTAPLPAACWLYAAASAPLLLVADELRKALARRASARARSRR